MIVVADASPLRYLIQIEHAHVLRALYGVLIVPPMVITELSKPATPPIVREWISDRPEWLRIQAPTSELVAVDVRLDPALLSEATLGEYWNRTEEDEAWSHLQRVP